MSKPGENRSPWSEVGLSPRAILMGRSKRKRSKLPTVKEIRKANPKGCPKMKFEPFGKKS